MISKKRTLILSASMLAGLSLSVLAFVGLGGKLSALGVQGGENSYQVTLSNASAFTSNQAKVKTSNGNDLIFSSESGSLSLGTNQILANVSKITGIQSVQVTFSGDPLLFTYDWMANFPRNRDGGTLNASGSVNFNGEKPDYFKIKANGNSVITSLSVTYSCAEIATIPNDAIALTLTGTAKNVIDGVKKGASVTFGGASVVTASDGSFTLNNALVGADNTLSIALDGYLEGTKTFALADYYSQIEAGNLTVDLGEIDLIKAQNPITIYNRNSHLVNGQIYRTLNGLRFTYDADFDITQNDFHYELFLDFGSSSPSDWDRTDSNDCDFNIYANGIRSSQKYKSSFGEGNPVFQNTLLPSGHYLTQVDLPYTYLKVSSSEVFGFNVISHDTGVSDRSLNLYGNDVEWANKYTYPRVALDSHVYQGNLNQDPFDFTAAGVVSSVKLGVVGDSDDYQYGIALKKDDNGVYVTAKKEVLSKPYLVDGTEYHFFLDTEQSDFTRATDNKIFHFQVGSGRWATKYVVNNANSVFNNAVQMPDLLALGVRLYSAEGATALYVPYTVLGISKTSIISIAANIEQGGGHWTSWQAPYISGYSATPHVEEPASFVHLDASLAVIAS